jgi:hypothetical protein
MHKGFGLVIFIVVVVILSTAVGGGFILGRMSVSPTNSAITQALFNQNQVSSPAQTAFAKRSYDPKQEIYPGHPLPAELINAPENTLVGFNCDGPYMQNANGQYFWAVQLENETYLKPLAADLSTDVTAANTYLKKIGYKQPAAYLTYCVTENNARYLLAGQPLPGGGAGSDTYIFDLAGGIGGATGGVIKSEPWPYFGCSSILQISQEAMYLFCSAGDGGFSAQAVYKKALLSGEVTPLIKCTSTAKADSENSEISCK